MTIGTTPTPVARAVLRTQSDHRLVELAREGRELAFEEIVRRYRPGLVAFASAYAPTDRAEDVVQESLVRSWDALRASTAEIRLRPWLYTIVRNRALNARRDAKSHEPLDETIDGVRQPSEIALAKHELQQVILAVNALPKSQREALVRSALDGHTHEQIATALATSTGSVRQLIYRARTQLREACGLFVPTPVLATLAGGGSVAGIAGAGAAGGSMALKGAAVVAIGALAVGGGFAVKRSESGRDPARTAEATTRDADPAPNDLVAASDSASSADRRQGQTAGDGQASGPGQQRGARGATANPPTNDGGAAQPTRTGQGGSGSHGPGPTGQQTDDSHGHGPGPPEDESSGPDEDDGDLEDSGHGGESPDQGSEEEPAELPAEESEVAEGSSPEPDDESADQDPEDDLEGATPD